MYFSAFTLVAASALVTLGSAQIDPNSVTQANRDYWCISQIASCPLICTQETADEGGSAATNSNTCDAASLAYSCVCDNGLSPNISEYSQTIPYFICTETNTQCVTNCGMNNNACAAACTANHPCGAQNPTRINATTTTSGSSTATGTDASGSVTAVYTGFGGAASTSSSSGSSNTASTSSTSKSSGANRLVLNFGQVYGLGVVVAGIVAGFAILL